MRLIVGENGGLGADPSSLAARLAVAVAAAGVTGGVVVVGVMGNSGATGVPVADFVNKVSINTTLLTAHSANSVGYSAFPKA